MTEKINFIIAIIICKFTSIKKHLQHTGGSYYPGRLAIEHYPSFLECASKDITTVLVVGTNGKTTVTRFISHMLENLGVHHFSNRSGANMLHGIATSYGLNCTVFGKKKSKTAIIECDELYVKQVIEILKPSVIVVTNISDDQYYRLGKSNNTVKIFLEDFQKADSSKFCLNKDNKYAVELGEKLKENCFYYSSSGNTVIVNGRGFTVPSNINEDYNIENAAAACLCVDLLGYSVKKAVESLYTIKLPFGRMERFSVEDTNVLLTLIKNAVGTNAVINALKKNNDNHVLVLSINNNMMDDLDLSWLDSVDFEALENIFSEIYVTGTCSRVLLNKFNGSCKILKDPIVQFVKSLNLPVTILANYTAMMEIREKFASHGYVKHFWKE